MYINVSGTQYILHLPLLPLEFGDRGPEVFQVVLRSGLLGFQGISLLLKISNFLLPGSSLSLIIMLGTDCKEQPQNKAAEYMYEHK